MLYFYHIYVIDYYFFRHKKYSYLGVPDSYTWSATAASTVAY